MKDEIQIMFKSEEEFSARSFNYKTNQVNVVNIIKYKTAESTLMKFSLYFEDKIFLEENQEELIGEEKDLTDLEIFVKKARKLLDTSIFLLDGKALDEKQTFKNSYEMHLERMY